MGDHRNNRKRSYPIYTNFSVSRFQAIYIRTINLGPAYLIGVNLKRHFCHFGLLSALKRYFRSAKTEILEEDLQSREWSSSDDGG